MIRATTEIETRMRAVTQEIWHRARPSFLERVDLIEHAIIALLSGTSSEEERDAARREAHRLAGSLGTFGVHRGSEIARELEAVFAGAHALIENRLLVAAEQVIELRSLLEEAPPPALESPGDTSATPQHSAEAASVLVIDDDETFLAVVSTQLRSMGHTAVPFDDPMRALGTLDRAAPDLVVIDVDMPGVTGIDLVRVIRAQPHSRHVPIVVLTGHGDPTTVRAAYAAGADDVVSKSERESEFGLRVTNRLERARQMRTGHTAAAAVTGGIDQLGTGRAVDWLIRLARRHRRAACVAMIGIDHFEALQEQHGQVAAGVVLQRFAERLTRAFRNEDVVARWNHAAFVVAMFDVDAQHGERRLGAVLDALRADSFADASGATFSVTATAGLAEHSRAYPDGRSVLAAAERTLQDAEAHRRGSIVVSGTPDGDDSMVDVALVEDDPALASLLMHALANHGVRVRWLADGRQAADQLCGEQPALRPRVMLLDVSLPGLDGLALLRQLRDSGTLRDTRVIVISARASESEMLLAFSLGAFDFVGKPLSVPLLMQRLHRALNA